MLKPLMVICVLCCFSAVHAQDAAPTRYGISPYPQQLVPQQGEFVITAKTKLLAPAAFKNEATQLQALITQGLGKTLPLATKAGSATISFQQNDQLEGEEDYTLTASTTQLIITAKTATGAFRAVETI